MKKQVYRLLTMLSLLLMLSVVSVKAQSNRVSINVPFDFTVGQRSFPAGRYTIEPMKRDSLNVWLLRHKTDNESALFTTIPVWTIRNQQQSRLVFTQVDGEHFLTQIWTAGETSGRALRQPKSQRVLAKNGTKPEYVVINADQ